MESNNGSPSTDLAAPKMQFHLHDRGMTLLEQAGVVGLWMTLKELERYYPSPAQRPGQLDWSLSSHAISLCWEGYDAEVLDWLLKQAFQTDDHGLIRLVGLSSQIAGSHSQIAMHQGITGTFLQHNQSYDSSGKARLLLEIDGQKITVWYKQLTAYNHQTFAKRLCDKQGNLLQEPIRIVGWLYPGATRTHNAFGESTKFEATPENAFLLLFAPVACWYFMLSTESVDRAIQYALVIPAVNDLAAYAEADRAIRSASYEHFWAANLEEAGLKLLMLQEEKVPIETSKVRRCQSILFGKTKWTGHQIVRKKVAIIEATKESLLNYQLSYQCFPKNIVCKDKERVYIGVSGTRGMIAANLTRGLAWWFCLFGEDGNQSLSEPTYVEREGLLKMIEEAEWQDQSKKLFVKACHQALQRIYAKIYDRTPEGNYAQIERRNVRLRSELGRCKNVTTLRNAISRLFAEAGQIPILQEHWEELLPITTGEVDWRITRDLTLLALSSYPKSDTSKKNAAGTKSLEDLQLNKEDDA